MWVRTTDFGDDKDRVIRRSNGEYTYFAADAAYYLNKGDRGFAHKIYLLGADHHGYVHRLKALAGAAGDDPRRTSRCSSAARVDQRRQAVQARGHHLRARRPASSGWAPRAALLPRAVPRRLAPDARSRDPAEAHETTTPCSTCSTRTRALSTSRATPPIPASTGRIRPELLAHETESALLGALQEYPRVVAFAAEVREPHRVARYLEELAGLYHRWYDNCRVIPLGDAPVEPVHRTRLWLNDATARCCATASLCSASAPRNGCSHDGCRPPPAVAPAAGSPRR